MDYYLDNAATTKISPGVVKAMNNAIKDYGNPSSLHNLGESSRELVEKARKKIASKINASPNEIYFTSGGTEANNIAIQGLALASNKNEIIISSIEHASALETCKVFEKEGYKVHYINIHEDGTTDLDHLKKLVSKKIGLVTIMHANNETGVIQPVEKISKICEKFKVPFHSDAVQTFGKLDIDVKKLRVSALSLSAHKIHGPKGVGALYIRKGTNISPILYGGHQEKSLRPGTENVIGIVGFASCEDYPSKKVAKLRDYMEKQILKIPNSSVNGTNDRVCGILNVSFKGLEGETLLFHLNLENIYVSTGSACDSRSISPSHVLTAMGKTKEESYGAIRFSLSKYTTKKDVDHVVDKLKTIVKTLQTIK